MNCLQENSCVYFVNWHSVAPKKNLSTYIKSCLFGIWNWLWKLRFQEIKVYGAMSIHKISLKPIHFLDNIMLILDPELETLQPTWLLNTFCLFESILRLSRCSIVTTLIYGWFHVEQKKNVGQRPSSLFSENKKGNMKVPQPSAFLLAFICYLVTRH